MRTGWELHRRRGTLALLLITMLSLLLLAACREGAARGDRPTPGLPPTREATRPAPTATAAAREGTKEGGSMTRNRIAYVGADGNVYTIRPDGTDSLRLTDNDIRVGPLGNIMAQAAAVGRVIYAWPTWSPDGSRLAVSRITIEQNAVASTLLTIDASTGKATQVYDNAPESGFVAEGAPHYMYWSPDGRYLTFLASTPGALALFVSTLQDGVPPVGVIEGAPLYYNWAADSASLVIHRGNDLFLASSGAGGFHSPRYIGTVGVTFFAPSLSPDSGTMAYASEEGPKGVLYTARADATGRVEQGLGVAGSQRILDMGPYAAFHWSPTRDELAVADRLDGQGPLFQRLTLVGKDGSEQRVLADENLMAFFWSTNGDKIAFVTWNPRMQTFSWKYVERSGGKVVELAEFIPSRDFETLLSFFDQYSYSNSIWSPDGSQIVFSGTLGPRSERRNGGSPETDKVYVIDVREGAAPREIATSRYAVWSWR